MCSRQSNRGISTVVRHSDVSSAGEGEGRGEAEESRPAHTGTFSTEPCHGRHRTPKLALQALYPRDDSEIRERAHQINLNKGLAAPDDAATQP